MEETKRHDLIIILVMHVGYEKSHEKKGYKLENGSP